MQPSESGASKAETCRLKGLEVGPCAVWSGREGRLGRGEGRAGPEQRCRKIPRCSYIEVWPTSHC